MHELPVTESILKIALDTAAQAKAERITAIHLVIGSLSSIVDDSVQFYFDFLSENTAAKGAELHFRRVAARGTCGACGYQFEARPPLSPICPACEAASVQIRGGQEFYVESIEVETNENTCREENPECQ